MFALLRYRLALSRETNICARNVFRLLISSTNPQSRSFTTTMSPHKRHHFAPLGQSPSEGLLQLKGIVFDMDGTLCEPQNYMFGEMREALQIDKNIDILDHIHSLPEKEQREAFEKVRKIESKAMEKQIPQAGLVTLMEELDRHGIKKGICTRNFDMPVNHLLRNHIPGHLNPFAPVVTREFRPPKPSPAGILHIANAWGLVQSSTVPETPPEERPLPLIMVGDSVDDMAAGRDAGALTVLLRSEGKEELETDSRTDVVISRLDELVALLREGLKPQR
ncbi:putative hydrolase [Pseudocercospora fuligena]|uniref:Putative hydrolase n=1 Tax=Pseudocercospora fuligena TaxID=685502 RepID=A0A8H6VE79_9PEZI|nr:putative hydrolase [Pseudocercospora fuligena]